MSKTTDKERTPEPAGDSAAGEAWDLLASLVYPPPFLAIAQASGLRPATLGALRILDEPRAMSEIAAFLRCDNSNVTGIVDRLVADRLVARQAGPEDRRAIVVRLTPKGAGQFATMARAHEGWVDRLLSDFDAAEAEIVIEHLDGLSRRIRDGGAKQ